MKSLNEYRELTEEYLENPLIDCSRDIGTSMLNDLAFPLLLAVREVRTVALVDTRNALLYRLCVQTINKPSCCADKLLLFRYVV